MDETTKQPLTLEDLRAQIQRSNHAIIESQLTIEREKAVIGHSEFLLKTFSIPEKEKKDEPNSGVDK